MGLNFSIKVDARDIEDVQRRLGFTQRHVDAALRIMVRRTRQRAQREAREFVLEGRPASPFARSIVSVEQKAGMLAIVASPARPAASIHQGRRPGERPSLAALERWAERYGLSGSVPVSGRRRGGRGGTRSARRAIALRVQRLIERRGTHPIPYLAEGLRQTHPHIRRYLTEGAEYVLRRLARPGGA